MLLEVKPAKKMEIQPTTAELHHATSYWGFSQPTGFPASYCCGTEFSNSSGGIHVKLGSFSTIATEL